MKLAVSLLACAVLIAGAVDASAAKKEKPKEKEAPASKDAGSSKAALIGTYGDWKVYHVASGKARYCYISAQPASRKPDSAKGEKAYAFISERPSERVHDEISFVMGFELATADDLKEARAGKKPKKGKKDADAPSAPGAPSAAIGESNFDLAPVGSDLWIKNAAEEGKLIDEMRKGTNLVVAAASKKGRSTVDTYSLSGFTQAVDKANKDCAGR
jgi:invasion protein IalB